jgi:hypothetical protein
VVTNRGADGYGLTLPWVIGSILVDLVRQGGLRFLEPDEWLLQALLELGSIFGQQPIEDVE